MTEAEWMACTDPMSMREYIRLNHKARERKLRLFALACGQRFLHLLADERSRHAVDIADRFVEGMVTHQERAKVAEVAWDAARAAKSGQKIGAVIAAAVAAARMADSDRPLFAQRFGSSGETGQQYAWSAVHDSVFFMDKKDQCMLWRDLVGNPFGQASVAPAVVAWNDDTVVKLAEAIYHERAFDRLPLLADALEDAGCTEAGILGHCRGPGPHVRGCWVIDMLLARN